MRFSLGAWGRFPFPLRLPMARPFVTPVGLLAGLVVALSAQAALAQPADLIFSEYVEGSSFNKAVELYNPTAAPVDLGGYTLELYSNGSPAPTQTVALSGTLAPGAVFVAAHPSADPAVLAVADLTDGAVVNFNGDDAVVLRQGVVAVDVIGQVGVDPGSAWGSGLTSTQNRTLRRKPAACSGDADPGDAFDPAVLYDGYEQDTFDGLGTHTAACGSGPGNTAPSFTAVLADQAVAVGQDLQFDYDASDADGDDLTFSLVTGPPGATIDAATGLFSWTPTAADAGEAYAVTVTVSDGSAGTTTSATLTVPGASSVTSGVFFSEYVEGSSNNKAVEVYNATSEPVGLGSYELQLYFNGNTSPSTISLSGTLAPGAVYVVAHSAADPAVLAAADLVTGALTFNGDDAVALTNGAGVLDVVGQIGVDPGAAWGTGLASTQNHTLRRRPSVCTGDPDGSDAFDPADQFDGYEQDTFDGLGAHTASCGTGGGGRFSNVLTSTLVDAGQTVAVDYDAAGEGAGLSYTLLDGPGGASIDPATGAFSWTPTTTGVYPVTVVATGGGASADTTRAVVGVRGVLFAGQTGAELRASVRAAYAPAQTLGYGPARDVMYGEVDRGPDGTVVGVYTGFSVFLPDDVDPSSYLAENGINAEHTWPQSKGAADEPGRSDLHNLFPAKDNVNSARSNKPLAEVPDAQTQAWYRLGESQSAIPTTDIDAWSESAETAFEPREVHKGNAARAALYFYTVYESVSDAAFLAVQRDDFVDWVALDPADGDEVERTYEVSLRQGNVNPFLLDATLAARVVEDLDEPPSAVVATVAQARALPDGTLVTVTGVVTRAEGRLTRLQDDTAGIAVFQAFGGLRDAVDAGTVAGGDSLRVTGTLASFNGLRQITPSGPSPRFEVLSRDNTLPAPVRLTLAELADGGEAVESELVLVNGLTVQTTDETFQPDTSYPVTDGTATAVLRTPGEGDGLLDGEPVPGGPVAFVGVVGEFRGEYQLVPVEATDLQRLLACSASAPLSFDFDGNGSPTTVMAGDFDAVGADPVFGEFAGVRNESASGTAGSGASGTAVDLSACSFVAFDPFTERVTYSAVTPGTVAQESAYVLATQNGDQAFGRADALPDGPGAFALVEGTAVAGESVQTVFGRIVAAVVYDRDRSVFGSIGGAATPADLQAFAQALAAVAGGAVAGEEDAEVEVALVAAPNPVSGSGSVSFGLATSGDVTVSMYDALGRQVAVLASGAYGPGRHTVPLGASSLPTGVYVVRVVAGGEARTTRVTVVR